MIYISHLIPDEEMKEIIEGTGAGIESIEFSVSENLDHFSETLASYKKRLRFMGTEDIILHGPFLDLNPAAYDSEIQKVTFRRFSQCYQAAQELGAKKVVYHSCMYPEIYFTMGWAERVRDFIREFMETHKGITICMENVLDREWEPLVDAVKMVNHPDFQLCFDIGHAHCYSPISVESWARNLAPYVSHIHLHDNYGDRDAHNGLGDGNIPLKKIFKVLELSKRKSLTQRRGFGEDKSWIDRKFHTDGRTLHGKTDFTGGQTVTIECSSKEKIVQSYTLLQSCAASFMGDVPEGMKKIAQKLR